MHSRQSTVHTYCAKKKPQKKPKPQKPKKRAPGNGPVRESSKYSLEALVEDMKFRTGFGALDIAASVHGEHPRELLALPLLAEMVRQPNSNSRYKMLLDCVKRLSTVQDTVRPQYLQIHIWCCDTAVASGCSNQQ